MIHILDWIIYFVFLIIIWWNLPEDYKEGLQTIVGIWIEIYYTIVYCLIFYFYNWIDILQSLTHLKLHIQW